MLWSLSLIQTGNTIPSFLLYIIYFLVLKYACVFAGYFYNTQIWVTFVNGLFNLWYIIFESIIQSFFVTCIFLMVLLKILDSFWTYGSMMWVKF